MRQTQLYEAVRSYQGRLQATWDSFSLLAKTLVSRGRGCKIGEGDWKGQISSYKKIMGV